MKKVIEFLDNHFKFLIWINIVLLFVELSFSASHSLDPRMRLFLWTERLIASIYILEYVVRWTDSIREGERVSKYPLSILGLIDLLAFIPFLIGFGVPRQFLGWIRACRVLRMLKQFRYSRQLQIFVLAMWKARKLVCSIGFVASFISLFSAVMIYECEKVAQPDTFGNIWNVLFWYIPVTGTTVGYGDMFPVTIPGKFFAVTCLLTPLIAIVGALLGVLGSQLQECIEMDKAGVDPLEEFRRADS